tara:strand:- start:1634 stop:2947 length:1314 start_codon:yes stop_codon:yes gene_type:complete
MGTTNAMYLNELLHKSVGDWTRVPVSTNIGADTLIKATRLNAYDGGRDGLFDDRWVYVEDFLNAGEDRRVRKYYTANGTANVFGTNFTADASNTQNVRLHRYSYTDAQESINDAIKELRNVLHRRLDFWEVVSGDMLPNPFFRDWTSSSKPDKWTIKDGSATANTGGMYTLGAKKSMKLVATATNGLAYVSSDDYPRLLDAMGRTADLRAWARPTTADDAFVRIETKQADGTTQVLQSTTTCPVNEFSELSLTDQMLNDNLVQINVGVGVGTNGQSAHFTKSRLFGRTTYEYLLPNDFRDGALSDVEVQSNGDTNTIAPRFWSKARGWDIEDDGTDKFLRMPSSYPNDVYFRLKGYAPLSTVNAASDTIETDEENHLSMLIAYAKYLLYQKTEQPVSSEDKGRYETQAAKAYGEYKRLLPSGRMVPPSGPMRLGNGL